MFDFSPAKIDDVKSALAASGVQEALIKPLSRNHNDKNQVYSGVDFRPLYPMFDMRFNFRGKSESLKGRAHAKRKPIPEAVFRSFRWLDVDGREVPALNVKMIIYAQYPETRLSGFQTVENTMPASMSVEYTKQHPHDERFLVLGRRGGGDVIAMMIARPEAGFAEEVAQLPNASGSRVWKHLKISISSEARLAEKLSAVVGRPLLGRRLDATGETQPFNGTQVCGYTLEHALGIVPNSDKHGDFEGIELKSHTQKKVTLFTPEPDMGLYATDFPKFMTDYGYRDKDGHFRLTGIHRVGVRCKKSGLTLKVLNHTRGASLAAYANRDIHLGLVDDSGEMVAGWSLGRILNSWTSKHNEAVYVPARKRRCDDPEILAKGYQFEIEFGDQVMWCRETSAERLFDALYRGTLFLDPAPKYCPDNPALTKRRSQWRVNDIALAAMDLYADVRVVPLSSAPPN